MVTSFTIPSHGWFVTPMTQQLNSRGPPAHVAMPHGEVFSNLVQHGRSIHRPPPP